MTTHPRSPELRLALIASADEWSARALQSVLEPGGYRVQWVPTGAAAEERARSSAPDVILIAHSLPDRTGIELCRRLREEPLVMPGRPIIGIAPEALSRESHLSWLRAGAWDVVAFPLDLDELLLKLDQYLREDRRAQARLLVDAATGLYNAHGLVRRARELWAESARLHVGLACVVLGPELRAKGREAEPGAAIVAAVRRRITRAVLTHCRLSDTIGWLSRADLAILALGTDVEGGAQLGTRLARAIEIASPDPSDAVFELEVCAGYEVVRDIVASEPDPEGLLARASGALELARTAPDGRRIRRFEQRP